MTSKDIEVLERESLNKKLIEDLYKFIEDQQDNVDSLTVGEGSSYMLALTKFFEQYFNIFGEISIAHNRSTEEVRACQKKMIDFLSRMTSIMGLSNPTTFIHDSTLVSKEKTAILERDIDTHLAEAREMLIHGATIINETHQKIRETILEIKSQP